MPRAPDHILTLTDEQLEVAERLATAQRAVLDGPSGSGKTHLAVALAIVYAKLGRRILVVTPRKPLGMWLRQALQPHGVVVQTIDACARAALSSRWTNPPARRGFDDPEFFSAAAQAIEPARNRFDLVIAEEWQTTSASEQYFVDAVVDGRSFVAVQDSSRDLRDSPPLAASDHERLVLSEALRSPGRVGALDALYVHDGLDPLPSKRSKESVTVTRVDDPERLTGAVLKTVSALRRRGLASCEIGVVSALGRSQSGVVTSLCSPAAGPARMFQLTDAPALTGVACDSFAYWLGLERRAMVIVEAPTGLPRRRTRLHIAMSRAYDSVHFLLPANDVEVDASLSAWLQASAAARR